MKHLKTLTISIIAILVAALVASCGASSVSPVGDVPADGQQGGTQIDATQLPAFPFTDDSGAVDASGKGVSWLSHPDHLTPAASLYGAVDPGDPTCFLIEGYKHQYATFYKPDSIAYAIYKIPLGALEPDLLKMKVEAQVGAAGDVYWGAIANFTTMSWKFYGPSNAPDWSTDMTTVPYDFTSAAGDMYIALVVLPGQSLHITDITLDFKDGEKPKVWNVWGQAFENYATGSAHGGYDVIFTDIYTGVTYVTLTAVDGKWGMNLPTGEYRFEVIGNEMLLDVSGPVALIDWLPAGVGTRLDLDASGQIVYQGSNAVYAGAVVPMPLITANQY